MAKDLKDYLHLYLGCEGELRRLIYPKATNVCALTADVLKLVNITNHSFKPILRRLEDITEEEQIEYAGFINSVEYEDYATWGKGFITKIADSTKWLLSKHFDLFNLIENNLAIDRKTIISSPIKQ